MKRVSTTATALPSTNMGAVGKAWDEVSASFDRFCLAAGIDALGAMMEKDAEEGLWGSSRPERGTAWTPLGPNPRQAWISCRQGNSRAAARARPCWAGAVASELGPCGRGGLARQVGDEPDADQRLDAEIPPCGAASRGRCSGADGSRRVEVGSFAALRGVVGCAHEGMDGCGPVRARHHGGADRRYPHQ